MVGMKIRASFFITLLVIFTASFCYGFTDQRDVFAINSLYVALGNPPLSGWIPNGGDPCLELWEGVQCVNSNVTGIILNGANLGGELGDNLDIFTSMIEINLSDNHIGGSIPSNLPLTIRNFVLSANQFNGSIPDSVSSLTQLTDLELSGNNLSGQLPSALENLSSLMTLHLQDNHLSGALDVLQDLSLQDLNIENNLFSGPIPEKLLRIPNFKKDGNPFNTTTIPVSPPDQPALPPPPLSVHSGSGVRPGIENNGPSASQGPSTAESTNFWKTKKFFWAAIVAAFMLISFGILFFMLRCCKGKQRGDKFSKSHKMGASNARMGKSDDIESYGNSQNVTEKVSTDTVLRSKDGYGIAIPEIGTIPSQRYKVKEDMMTNEVSSKKVWEREKNMTGIDRTLMPPPLAPVEKLNVPPFVPTVITSGKRHVKSLNRAASVRSFTVASLQQYTDSFSQDNLLGGGTLGRVYRAELPDGKPLAVKKLDNMTSILQNDDEFLHLVESISKLQNANVLELEGYCVEHGQRLLIYEYCCNGTLHDALHSDGLPKKLSWNARIRVALGAARALEYLHEVCHPPMIHQNFKSANVLLDDELAVRVSDCGLAPLMSAGSVNQMSGQISSKGYGAPEFEMGTYSCQSDVYSFGVVMLELLTGRKAFDSSRSRGEQFLVRWAIPQLHDIEALSRMVDPSLNGAYPAKSLSRFADIISLCVQSEPEFRPPMSEIVQSLLHMIQREPPIRR